MYISDAHWSIISVNTGWRYILGSHYTPTIYQGWFSGERGIKLVGSWDGVKGYVSTFMTTCCPLVIFVYFYLFIKNEIIKYQLINLLNWCNMTFTADNLFPSHSCIGWHESNPHWDLNPGPQIERQMTYHLSCSSPSMDWTC